MLQINKPRPNVEAGAQPSEFVSPAELYTAFRTFLGRQYAVIVFVFVLVLALGAVYIFTAPAKYTGHAVLVIDTHKNQNFQQQSPLGDLPIDSATVDTQIEILKSENIATSVIKDLHLTEDPEFTSPYAGLVGTIFNFVTGLLTIGGSSVEGIQGISPEDRVMRGAVGVFERDMTIKRVGLTYAIEISNLLARIAPRKSPMRSPTPMWSMRWKPSTKRHAGPPCGCRTA